MDYLKHLSPAAQARLSSSFKRKWQRNARLRSLVNLLVNDDPDTVRDALDIARIVRETEHIAAIERGET